MSSKSYQQISTDILKIYDDNDNDSSHEIFHPDNTCDQMNTIQQFDDKIPKTDPLSSSKINYSKEKLDNFIRKSLKRKLEAKIDKDAKKTNCNVYHLKNDIVNDHSSTLLGDLVKTIKREKLGDRNKTQKEIVSVKKQEPEPPSSIEMEAPHVLFVDGKIVLKSVSVKQDSKIPDNHDNDDDDEIEYEEINETDKKKAVFRSSFRKNNIKTNTTWSTQETRMFYNCLRQVGMDFSLMETMFQDKNRVELKQKFKREQKIRPNLIEKTLQHNTGLCHDSFQDMMKTIESRKKIRNSK